MKFGNLTSKRLGVEKAKSTVFAALVIASIVVSFSIVTIQFLFGTIQFNNRVIERQEENVDILNENLKQIAEIEEAFDLFEATSSVDSQEVLDALPSKYDFPALATSIESLASRNGLILEIFDGNDLGDEASSREINPQPLEIPFTITVSGTYEDITNFAGDLEKSIRPISTTFYEISGTDENITVTMEAVSYYQPAQSLDIETETIR
jgi:Tfp pilus assembly protein PilO